MIEYFGEIKTEFKNTLPCSSGAQKGSNHGKKVEVENLVTHSHWIVQRDFRPLVFSIIGTFQGH